MIRSVFVFVTLNTVSLYLVSQFLDGFRVGGGAFAYVLIGVIIGLLNLFVKPVIKVLTLPFIFLTVGLFVIVINAAILWLAELLIAFLSIGNVSLEIIGFVNYLLATLLFGVINYLFQKLLK